MSDLISRADAIEAVRVCDVFLAYQGDKIANNIDGFVDSIVEQMRDNISRAVSALPSAEAVGWIPCSERLPSESGDYLCTIPLDADETYTEVLTFHKGRFYEDDDEWGATYHDDVLAWMPLPTPYKGGDTE
jgi:hypothetical protein